MPITQFDRNTYAEVWAALDAGEYVSTPASFRGKFFSPRYLFAARMAELDWNIERLGTLEARA